jgi:hypothetical protein
VTGESNPASNPTVIEAGKEVAKVVQKSAATVTTKSSPITGTLNALSGHTPGSLTTVLADLSSSNTSEADKVTLDNSLSGILHSTGEFASKAWKSVTKEIYKDMTGLRAGCVALNAIAIVAAGAFIFTVCGEVFAAATADAAADGGVAVLQEGGLDEEGTEIYDYLSAHIEIPDACACPFGKTVRTCFKRHTRTCLLHIYEHPFLSRKPGRAPSRM